MALLFLAAGAASGGLPINAILCPPVMLAAGMSLLDTIDGLFINLAYRWACSQPVRTVDHDLAVTGLSIAVAFIVGSVELLSIAADRLCLHGVVRRWISRVHLNVLGYISVGSFLLTWAPAVWRICRVEQKWPRRIAAGIGADVVRPDGTPTRQTGCATWKVRMAVCAAEVNIQLGSESTVVPGGPRPAADRRLWTRWIRLLGYGPWCAAQSRASPMPTLSKLKLSLDPAGGCHGR